MKNDGSTAGGSRLNLLLQEAYEAFRKGDFALAENEAEKALGIDFENPEVLATLKCAVYWKDRLIRLPDMETPEMRGDFLLKEFQGFQTRFLNHLDTPLTEGLFAIRQFVHSAAAEAFIQQIGLSGKAGNGLYLKAAKAFKGNGDFDQAIGYLETALENQRDDAQVLAEMADCFEMINETRKAKLYFREAFYINAQRVELDQLHSVLIKGVVDSLKGEGFPVGVLKEWIPVFAAIQGVFNVKRELKPLELGQLKQSIYALKNEFQDGAGPQGTLLPKLLNRYFWLIDHYLSVKEDRKKIEEVLLNIKLLDQKVYELYTH